MPLTEGIVDHFEKNGVRIFGPTKLAAELEGSKIFSKNFMQRHNIPTAAFASFSAEQRRDAEAFIRKFSGQFVIKADGLAAGKGVVICQSVDEGLRVIDEMMGLKIFGTAGSRIIVEEFMQGEEASVFAITDGESYKLLASAQDHKRIFDGDQGKNTGGMGAYAPAPVITDSLLCEIEQRIVHPTIQGMAKENRTYKGCLYVGLMITKEGPKVVEYNCRFGDPEAQVVLPLIDGDLAEIMYAAAENNLKNIELKMHEATAVCVIIASRGYPDKYETGKRIIGLEKLKDREDIVVFHSGTTSSGGDILSAGGRVLGVTAVGYKNDLEATIRSAYSAVGQITFDGAYYRSDIGQKGLKYIKN